MMLGSESAQRFELVLLLVAAVIPLEMLARRIRMPSAATLLLGGIMLALIPGTPDLTLDPDLIIALFLPPLLQASAYFTPWREFRADMRIITQLAVGAVVFTTFAVGWVTHLVLPSLPWAACFTLGAIVSPPDAVAAKAVLHGVRLPRRIVLLLEGESLVNDATGLVLFRFAVVAALTGTFSFGEAAATFVSLALGGIAVGIACAWLALWLERKLREPGLIIAVSFLAAWGSFIGADKLQASGVLSTVACGLVIGSRQHEVLDAATRLRARATWDVVVFVLESLVFILIGLELRGVVERLGGWAAALRLAPVVAAIVLAVIVSRFVWIVPTTYLVRAVLPGLRRRDPYPPLSAPIVMSWAGMRGVVSLTAALALPEHFPGRDFILGATFAVILGTVFLQGATLAPLIRLTQPRYLDHERRVLTEHQARAALAEAQRRTVERQAHADDGTLRHPRLLEQYTYRARAAERFSAAVEELASRRHEHFTVMLSATAAGRAEMLRLYREGMIDDEVLQLLEQELDLDELSVRRRVEET
jgi:Na+/H+ antiporter